MTIQEFVNKYAEELYNNNSINYFENLKSRIDGLIINSRPITLDEKIDIWKRIESKVREITANETKHIYENENQGLLTLISVTIRSLESDKKEG